MRELALQRAAGEIHLRREPRRRAWLSRPKAPARAAGGAALQRHEQLHGRGCRRRYLAGEQDPLHAGGPADPGRFGAAQLLHQAVVASPAPHPALGAERVGGELEHGAGVVVEAPHERGVDLVGDAGRVEQRADLGEVLGVPAVEPVQQAGRVLHHRAGAGVFGVERPQGVQVDAGPDLLGELALVGAQVGGEALAVGAPALGTAEAREAQPHLAHAERAQQGAGKGDRLGVEGGVLRAQCLGPHLPELPVPPRLGALVAEEARQVPQLHRLAALVHAVFDVGAADRGGALRTQGQLAPARVLEAEHLLADDVAGGAHPAGEQLGGLEGGGLDAFVAGRLEDRPGAGLERGPRRRLLTEHVEGAPRGFDLGGAQRAEAPGPAAGATTGTLSRSSARNGFVSRSRCRVVMPM